MAHTAHGEEELRSPGSPRERSNVKVKEMSKLFDGAPPANVTKEKLVRQRSSSEPSSPEPKRSPRPPPLDISPPHNKSLRPAFSKLSPIPPSPTLLSNGEADELSDELKPNTTTFSRKLTSSIRRRLSTKAKTGQRFSASDVLDDRRPRSPPLVKDDLVVMRAEEKSNYTASLGRTEHSGKVKKGFLRKSGRNNSFRRKSDSNLNKNVVKKANEMDGGAGSHEDLAKALKQTKIVSFCPHPRPRAVEK
ncbi:hypothetical protein OS493_013818 [Desmophyllum pertusum]|uniref:Uncharacterized protein n=1 Tax=Desmophyllum pertusum TaxID=174260 RepID=A0A9X0D5N8_9CNID|nr:hypothetical protein OS493_013818 [Desmophyllum pertusum]